MRCCCPAERHVAASHWTGLSLLGGLPTARPTVIHVLAELPHRIELDGVIGHRSGTIEDGDVIVRDGMRCTSPLRTVIDLSGPMTARALGEGGRRLPSPAVADDSTTFASESIEHGRPRAAPSRPCGRSLSSDFRATTRARAQLEARILRIIDANGLPRPTQQHRVRYGRHRYRLDFAWPDRKLYLEGNGFGWHNLASDLASDASPAERARARRLGAD